MFKHMATLKLVCGENVSIRFVGEINLAKYLLNEVETFTSAFDKGRFF